MTIHLMPYGDRAVMAAYGLIKLGSPGPSGERSLDVDPSCLEVIAAAAELVASIVDPAAVAARLQCAVEDGHAVEPYVPVTTPAGASSGSRPGQTRRQHCVSARMASEDRPTADVVHQHSLAGGQGHGTGRRPVPSTVAKKVLVRPSVTSPR